MQKIFLPFIAKHCTYNYFFECNQLLKIMGVIVCVQYSLGSDFRQPQGSYLRHIWPRARIQQFILIYTLHFCNSEQWPNTFLSSMEYGWTVLPRRKGCQIKSNKFCFFFSVYMAFVSDFGTVRDGENSLMQKKQH